MSRLPEEPPRDATVVGSAYDPSLSYAKADLHLHSNYSYDVLNIPDFSPRNLYQKAVRVGMGFFTLTDHDTMRGIEALRRELDEEYAGALPIPLIPGIELTVRDPRIGHTIHVNVFGLDQSQMLELARRRKFIDRFLDFCRSEDLTHVYNHPFWFQSGERGSKEAVESLVGEFPLIELNAGRIPQLNERTVALARRRGKEVIATSDSHTGFVGKAYSMAPGTTPAEFLANLRSGVSVSIPSHAGFRDFAREIIETIELVFLRTSAFKLKATLLRGMPVSQWIARTALQSDLVMSPSPIKPAACKLLQILAYPPAYAFIWRQVRMHGRMGALDAPAG